MKRPSDDLFRLIASMNRSERRYFKVFASGGSGEKNYVRLFDAISRQKVYDEEAIIRQFAGESLVNNLSYTKNYLYNLILKALRVYHADLSAEARLHDLFRSVEILAEKGLFDQCRKLLEKGRTMIERNNEYVMQFHLLQWENSLYRRRMDLEGLTEHLQREEELRAVERYKNFLEYGRLSQRMFIALRRNANVRGPERLEPFREIMAHPLLRDESPALTFEAKAWFHDLHGIWAGIREDLPEEYRHSRDLLDLLESHPERIAAAPHNYVAALVRFAEICIRLDQLDLFGESLKRLRGLADSLGTSLSATDQRRLELSAGSRADNLELSFYIANGEFAEGRERALEIEGRLKKMEEGLELPYRNDYWYNLAVFNFGLHEYDRSLHWINRIVNESDQDVQQGVYGFARIFSLIVHLELGNIELLENAVRSLRRYFSRRDRLYGFEEAFLLFLRDIRNSVDRAGEIDACRRLLETVVALEEDPFESRVFRFFDVKSWLRGKIEGKTFADVIREKIQAERKEREKP